MIAFTNTSEEIDGAAEQDHVINEFCQCVHFWKFPPLSNLSAIFVSPWETFLN
jgi:hypothetical protein